MKQISWRRISVLGVVLMGASAVTAAVLPNKSEVRDAIGSVTQSSLNGGAALSCTVSNGATPEKACNVTAGTLTTVGSDLNSVNSLNPQTVNNTTTF